MRARNKMRFARELFHTHDPRAPRSLIILDYPVTPKPRFSQTIRTQSFTKF
jgi:hypothetical protein